jgi:hypothetical protein
MDRAFARATRPMGRLLFSAALVLAAAAGLAQAAPPSNQMTYQGRLLTSGAPANGPFTIRFGFFNGAVGGSEIASQTKAGVVVTNGLFTTTLGPTLVDGPTVGIYSNLADIFRDHSSAHVEITVDGVLLGTRQPVNSAPYAQNAFRAHSLDNVSITDDSVWTVQAPDGISSFSINGINLRVQIGDTIGDRLVLQGSLIMRAEGGGDVDQTIFFMNGGDAAGEWLRWDDSDDRFEFTDALTIDGPLTVGNQLSAAIEPFSRFGGSTPLSTGMNNLSDLFVSDDLEVRSSLIVSGNVLMRSNQADGDAVFNFREGGSDTAKSFRWDDSEDRFVFNDDILLGQSANFELTTLSGGDVPDGVAEIKSTGAVVIRVDTNSNESGASAGLFAITCNSTQLLLRLQGTDEANLELDNGVVTDAFDFAEAFRVAPGQTLEPGDVVVHAVGSGLNEHCAQSNAAGERLLLGVVSTNPAFTAGMSFEEADRVDPKLTAQRDAAKAAGNGAEVARLEALMTEMVKKVWKPIAQIGRVPTKVDGSFGPIKAGDYLTSSPTPGHAMKLTGPGMALGVALEDFAGDGKGLITVFVRPGWHGDPTGALAEVRAENADLKSRLERLERLMSPALAKK